MNWKCLICAAVLSAMTVSAMDLVKDGKPVSEIVVAENAPEGTLLAARDLQLHLEKISGAKLRIVTPDRIQAENLICVGESEATRKAGYRMPAFERSGYDIQVKGNLTVLTGPAFKFKPLKSLYEKDLHPQSRLLSGGAESAFAEEDCGPMHAVSAFLEHLGVRFYAPYEEGTVIPHRNSVSVKDFRETKTAAFARRVYCGGAPDRDPESAMWFRRLKSGSSLKPAGVLPLAAVLKNNARPEWAAMDKKGNRLLTNDGCVFPRFTDRSFQLACAEYARRMFDANPEMKELELVLPSLRGINDERDLDTWHTKKVFPQPVNDDIMAAFYLAVAAEVRKTHPNRILTCRTGFPLAEYRQKLTGSLKFQPKSQSVVVYAQQKGRDKYEKQIADLADWFGKYPMQQREWWNEFGCAAAPRQGFWFMHGLQQIRKAQRPLVSGIVIDAGFASDRLAEVPLTHLMYYVNSKLLWDPDLDLDALLNEYCSLWFGPAAAEMKTFLAYAENLASQQDRRAVSILNEKVRDLDLDFWFELLSKAKAKTAPDTVYRRRVEDLENVFAPLKTFFSQPAPDGTLITGKILPKETVCDGDFSKYGKWFTVPGGTAGRRTEFSLAFSEDRARMFAAVRCYDPNLPKLEKALLPPDDPAIFRSEHVRIEFNPMGKNGYMAAVDRCGNFADGSADPDELAKNGCFLGWNGPKTRTWTKQFADRWEAEIAIDVNNCGKKPDYGDPWEIGVIRCSGNEQPDAGKPARLGRHYTHRVTIPKVDSQNRPLTFYYDRPEKLPGTPDESVYTVKRAAGPVDLSSPWDGKDWKNIPEIRMGWEMVNGRSSGFRPDARAKIQYDNQYIYVLYLVRDRYVRGTFKDDLNMVCLDSCMEFFIQPDKKGPYFNFECNCIGTLLLYEAIRQGTRLKMGPVTQEELREIKRFSTLPRDLSGEIEKPVTWRLGLQIPVSFFMKRAGVKLPLSGQVWYGNVYKCADWTSHPCWLTWKKIPAFHYPEGFGAFVFE